MNVLVAEDEVISRCLLQHYLEQWGHGVVVAENGAEAWREFEAGDFSLVISDWVMPEMDGLELVRRIRGSHTPQYVYIIMLTARSHKEDIIAGMEAGADDFVTKPFDGDELRVRLRAGQRIVKLEAALRSSLEDLAEVRRREIEIGARIQQTLLLGQPPPASAALQVAPLTIPSQQIDGDFYDFFPYNDHCLDVVVGDAMGKGVPAALIGAAIKSQFLRALSHLVAAAPPGRLPEPEEIVSRLHSEVVGQFIGLEQFTTLCYARFDLRRRQISFVDCGHNKTIHYRHRTGICTLLEGINMPLGFSEREVYTQITEPFDPGDAFLFYSDGVTEAPDATGKLFGVDRLVDVIQAHAHLPANQLVEQVRETVVAYSHSETFADDLTCVAVKIGRDDEPTALAHAEWEVTSHLVELPRVRVLLRQFCAATSPPVLDDNSIEHLELAVTEALSNIIRHAYHGLAGEVIQMTADAFIDRVCVRLEHVGEAFAPYEIEPPPPDAWREGGYGIYIMAQTVDELLYSHDGMGNNCITLVKGQKGGVRHDARC